MPKDLNSDKWDKMINCYMTTYSSSVTHFQVKIDPLNLAEKILDWHFGQSFD
jgi:hypothetical protein